MQADKEPARELDEESNLRRRQPRCRTVRASNRLYLSLVGYSFCYIGNNSEDSIRSPWDMDTTAHFHKWSKFFWQTIGQKGVIKRARIWNNRTQHRLCSSILQYLFCILNFFSWLVNELGKIYHDIFAESQCGEERIADTKRESCKIARKALPQC